MSPLTDIAALSPATTAPRPNPAASLGQDDFLKLMTAQLTSQDPFKPLDNTQMVAQMAQFSQVAGIAEMNASLASIAQQLSGGGSRVTDASSWIGRAMLVDSAIAAPLSDGSYRGEITLAEDADAVTVALVDERGATVHSQDFGERGAGEIAFSWDGGEAASGPLRIVVTATRSGDEVATNTRSWTEIGAIQSPASGQQSRLVTPLGLFAPDAALRLA